MIEDWWIPLYNWIGLYKIPLYNANQPLTQASLYGFKSLLCKHPDRLDDTANQVSCIKHRIHKKRTYPHRPLIVHQGKVLGSISTSYYRSGAICSIYTDKLHFMTYVGWNTYKPTVQPILNWWCWKLHANWIEMWILAWVKNTNYDKDIWQQNPSIIWYLMITFQHQLLSQVWVQI